MSPSKSTIADKYIVWDRHEARQTHRQATRRHCGQMCVWFRILVDLLVAISQHCNTHAGSVVVRTKRKCFDRSSQSFRTQTRTTPLARQTAVLVEVAGVRLQHEASRTGVESALLRLATYSPILLPLAIFSVWLKWKNASSQWWCGKRRVVTASLAHPCFNVIK